MIPHSRPWITDADVDAVVGRLHSGMIAQGAAAARLESMLAERYGFAAAIAVGSGCQALLLALKSSGIGPGAKVGLPTYVCPELLGVVEAIGAEPAIADVDESYQLDWQDPALDDERIKAVVVPSLFGWRASGPPTGLPGVSIVHDWAQYLPKGGAFADVEIAILSFGATKALAAGEGGAVLVRDPELARRVRDFKRITGSRYGVNLYPFSDLQAALALTQLGRLDEMIDRRQAVAAQYLRVAAALPAVSALQPTPQDVPFRLPMRLVADRAPQLTGGVDALIEAFARHGVAARRPVADLLHHVRAAGRHFPIAERLYAETFSLPLYPSIASAEINVVVGAMREVLSV